MSLSTPTLYEESQIKEILRAGKAPIVEKGALHESHLRIYTEPLERKEIKRETAWKMLMNVKDIRLHPSKWATTDRFFTFPLSVVKESSDALRALYRVFDARNANFDQRYETPKSESKGQALLKRLKVHSYIKNTAKVVLKNRPNTFVVLDKDKKGLVYPVTVNNDRLINLEFVGDSKVELNYIAFIHHKEQTDKGEVTYIAFYDNTHYRVYKKTPNGSIDLVLKNPHQLGSCPARPFLSESRVESNKLDRFNPFQEVRAVLANFVLFECFMLHSQYYGSFPIIEMPKQTCSNDDCEDGYIYDTTDTGQETRIECKDCQDLATIMGSGTVLEIDPARYNQERDTSGYLRFVSPPLENLKYQDGKQTARRYEIKEAVTGINDVMSDQAVNIEQVRAVMESAKKPLSFIARQLDLLDTWIVESAHKLELGISMKRFSNWGTEWYLFTEDQLQQLYKGAKDGGLPEAEIRDLYTLLIETKYKTNPSKVREKIIELNINPAPFSSIEECYKRHEKGVMSREDLTIKANFNKYILRFQRENGAIGEFQQEALIKGTATLDNIIEDIIKIIQLYAAKDMLSESGEQSTDSENGRTGQGNQPQS